MRIALAQVATAVGDVSGNARRIADAIREARGRGAELVLFPELALAGYPPDDLLLDPGFLRAIAAALPELANVAPELPVILGAPVLVASGGASSNPRRGAARLRPSQPRDAYAARGAAPAEGLVGMGWAQASCAPTAERQVAWPSGRDASALRRAGPAEGVAGVGRAQTSCAPTADRQVAWHAEGLAGAGWTQASCAPARPRLLNAAVLLHGRQVRAVRGKRLLPGTDVFSEPRYFAPGEPAPPLELGGRRVGLLVCEDLWDEVYPESPATELVAQGADLLLCLNASPFRRGVLAERLRLARRPGVDLAYVNAVGAQDELIFDGGSFAVGADGQLRALLPTCEEALAVVDLQGPPPRVTLPDDGLRTHQALLLGIRDFLDKNRLPGAVVGVSGGVDSALVLALATEALGPGRVRALHLPLRYTSAESRALSRALCRNLGVELLELDLQGTHEAAERELAGALPRGLAGKAAENVQARLRGLALMTYVNQVGGVLLNTSNKTELALGYGTLYGDLAGGLSPIGDLTKPEVYAHCRRFYADVIPSGILTRPPTAELRPGQTDPFDYDRVGPGVEALIQGREPQDATPTELADWRRRIRAAEFKRRQAPPVLKLSDRAFGRGWRLPLTHGWAGDAPPDLAQRLAT
ncbi:MAG: NAD(+) synthase [Planctomycetota bacterium]